MLIKVKPNSRIIGKHDAVTIFPFIFISRDKANDKALILHEKVHLKQAINPKIWFGWIFKHKETKRNMELEAYTVQLDFIMEKYIKENPNQNPTVYKKYYDRVARLFAGYLRDNYDFSADIYNIALQTFNTNFTKKYLQH